MDDHSTSTEFSAVKVHQHVSQHKGVLFLGADEVESEENQHDVTYNKDGIETYQHNMGEQSKKVRAEKTHSKEN